MRGPTILHVDLDAFFASVEQRDHPELRGRPVIVGGRPGDRGVVSAASYEARRFGVRSAMPLRTAARLCPDGVFVPVDGRRYVEASRAVMAILGRYTPRIEQVSIDEAFLDVAGSEALHGSPEAIAHAIRAVVRAEQGLTVSVGVAVNRLVAKIASDLRKPDGLVIVPLGTEAELLATLPISRLWGVGERTRLALADYGVTTIGDLAALPDDLLLRRFGSQGPVLAERARGIDHTPVSSDGAVKSVSNEHTFDVDTADPERIERTLLGLSESVARRLRADGLKAATIAVKIRDSGFETHTRQRTLPEPTDLADTIWRTARELAEPGLRGIRVRLLGVGASGLTDREQLGLFDDEPRDARAERAQRAADAVRERFGSDAIVRARLLDDEIRDPFGRSDNRGGTPRPERSRQTDGA
jgi:DNA polymerase-4